jgi:quinol monooxygenase YgiN
MSTLVRFTPKSVTTEQYEQVMRQLDESGDWLPDGLDYHVAFGSKGDIRVSEVWDSKEQFEAFGKRLMPLLQEAGIEFESPPELIEIQNIEKR